MSAKNHTINWNDVDSIRAIIRKHLRAAASDISTIDVSMEDVSAAIGSDLGYGADMGNKLASYVRGAKKLRKISNNNSAL